MKTIIDIEMTFKEAEKKVIKKLQDEAQVYSDNIKSDFQFAINQNTPQGVTHTIETKGTFCRYAEMNRLLDTIRKLEIIGSRNSTQWTHRKENYKRKDTCITSNQQLDWQRQTKCTYEDMEKLADCIFQDKKDDFYKCLSNIIKNKRLSERITRNIFGTASKHKT